MGCCCAVARRRGLPQFTRSGSPIFAIVRGCPVHDNPARNLVVWAGRDADLVSRHAQSTRIQNRREPASSAAEHDYAGATLNGFVFRGTGIDERLVRKLHAGAFLENADNVAFVGGTGTGKTRLAKAIANNATSLGKHGFFVSAFDLIARLESEATSGAGTFAFELERADFLVIDELGRLPIDSVGKAQLYRLLAGLHGRTSVIVTTHLRFEQWDRMFDDRDLTAALVDRFASRCHLVETGSESRRNHQSKRTPVATQKLARLSNVLEHKRRGRKTPSAA